MSKHPKQGENEWVVERLIEAAIRKAIPTAEITCYTDMESAPATHGLHLPYPDGTALEILIQRR